MTFGHVNRLLRHVLEVQDARLDHLLSLYRRIVVIARVQLSDRM